MAPHSISPTRLGGSSSASSDSNGGDHVKVANGIEPETFRPNKEHKPESPSIPIAIVGMACRFSGGVQNPSQLWRLCANGKDGWSPIPEARFDVKSLYHANSAKAGRSNVIGGYFLDDDVSHFDAAFFNLASDAASGLDPQARLLLESVYEATEDAGIPLERLAGTNTAVYTGTFNKDYHEIQTKDAEVLSRSFLAGTGTAMLSNRISHFYDLQGPSVSIDTGCSSGLVAVHQGCQSIRSGESDLSVICAASTLLSQDAFISASTIGAIGAEGRCHAWDSRAAGYGRGEGVASLILKPLSVALQDGDQVHAVIKDTGVNQNGKTTTITSPSADAQAKLIKECYRRAGLDISDTGYVEAHMTGTAAGDPVEAEAIARTFGQSRLGRDPVVVGSVKTNVGHTEPVSGLAAVIKTCYALKHAKIAPNLNYAVTNPNINLQEGHMEVPAALRNWPRDTVLRASVNNFGYGGTNAHAIMEPAPSTSHGGSQAEDDQSRLQGSQSQIFVISAKDSAACQAMMRRLASHIAETLPSPHDLAYTLSERRTMHSWVTAIRATSIEGLTQRLMETERKATFAHKRPRLGFVFNGQGAQWHAMSRELLAAYTVFDDAIVKAGEILSEYGATWCLKEELMRDPATTRVSEVSLSQPISVAVQIALVDLLWSWGIQPSAITSHSSGEIAAAYAARMISFKQALGVAYHRGELAARQLAEAHMEGGMLAAGVDQQSAEKYITEVTSGRLVVACINSPGSVTISGDMAAIEDIASNLDRDGLFARKLKVPTAYHSHHMLPMAEEYAQKLQEVFSTPPRTGWEGPLITSPVTGEMVLSPKALGPSHWVQNLVKPVEFSKAFENMCFSGPAQSANVDLIVEIGPHSTLAGPIRQILKARDVKITYTTCLKRLNDAVETMQDLACTLVEHGYPVNLKSVNSPVEGTRHVFVADLPSYQWNHGTSFWVEPRVAREQRFKRFAPHELLGTPLNGSSPLTPTWRNFLRPAEIEWLKDHQIDGTVVFPGAGYIAMALEAVRLLSDASEETIRGYRLRDINIMNALVIPESELGVETQICLRPCSEKELDHEGWYEFEVCSLANGNTWITHCQGAITAEKNNHRDTASQQVQTRSEETFFDPGVQTHDVDIAVLFSGLRDRGIYHGPIFQNLLRSVSAGSRAVTDFTISDIACQEHEYILHPTTLDSVLQASFSSLPGDLSKNSMVLPRSIRSLNVPRQFKRHGGQKLKAFSELVKAEKQGYTSDIAVASSDEGGNEYILEMEGFFGSAVPRSVDLSDDEPGICSQVCWELDILHNPLPAFRSSMVIPLQEHEKELEKKLSRVSFNFLHDAVVDLEGQESDSWEWYHKRFFSWMQQIVAQGKAGELGPGCETWSKSSRGSKKMLADELSASGAAGRLTVRVGQNLARIIRGEVVPLELMMENDLLNQFYMQHEALKTRSYSHLAKVVELYAVKNPGAHVLEIGAGTGGATTTVLEGFGKRGGGKGTVLGDYTFTDISPGFFEAAREKFAPWAGMMDFKKLDIEIDPLAQSFAPHSFDLIVAASCLHATKSLTRTMQHVRKLLKPGGTLLLIEATSDRLEGQLIFGTLAGWWLGEEPERQNSPNAPLEMWDEVLRQTGFTGVDFEISDYDEPEFQSARVMLSRASATTGDAISIIVDDGTDVKSQVWIAELSSAIHKKTGVLPAVVELSDSTRYTDTICITLLEADVPYVAQMNEAAFDKLKALLLSSSGVLWVTRGGLVDAQDPAFSASEGLLRTMRQEESYKRWIRLDFSQDEELRTRENISHIVHVLEQCFNRETEATDVEWEFSSKNGELRVPRVYPDKSQDAIARDLNVLPQPEFQPFKQPGRPLIWETPRSGTMELNVHFVENKAIVDTDVPPGMVEIEAKAFGLNFREVMVALGQLEEPLTGHECSGIITALGPDTDQSGLKVGDRVAALCKFRLASMSRTYWTSVVKLPDVAALSWEEAASFPAAYATAYGSLTQIARLQKGESVLIHAATGATGQAAIAVAQHVGAKVFATCSTKEKSDLLVQHHGLKPDHIFASRDASFAAAVMAKTEGKGVNVILNSLSGPLLKATWDCIAQFGRLVDITKVDMEANRRLETRPFGRCATYSSFDLLQGTEYRGEQTHKALTRGLDIILVRGKPPVRPITAFPISDMETAMRRMQGGAHMGKLVLVPHDEDKVKVIKTASPLSLNNPDETYLICGGLGGIGRAVAQWMIEEGASNLVLVSRNATSHRDGGVLRDLAEAAKCRLEIFDCDVSDESSLHELISKCAAVGLPPFRGAINAAMVLDDTVLERMTFDQWSAGIRPKINSSWNIHLHLTDLKFYIMLSSVAGVAGHMSQANYAAGNSYEDALARHRTALGLPAVTIDLGAVRSVGYVADREASGDDRLRARVENVGFGSIDLEQVLRVVEHAIRDPLRSKPSDSQVVVGPNYNTLTTESAMRHDRRFGTLRVVNQQRLKASTGSKDRTSAAALAQELSKTSTLGEATLVLTQAISAKMSQIFNIPLSDIDTDLPMSRYGVDSLVAVELRNWLSGGAKAKVTVFEILQSASLAEFAELVANKSEGLTCKE